MKLRRARAEDAPALAALKLATFRETFLEEFGIAYPPADLAVFEAETYGPEQVAAELADLAHATWVVEDEAGALAGYAHVGPCKLPHPEASADQSELYQLYVRRAAQGCGAGRLLMDAALDWLAQARPGPVWLGVWSGNARAQAVYAARGFRKVGEYDFAVGNWRDHEFILRLD